MTNKTKGTILYKPNISHNPKNIKTISWTGIKITKVVLGSYYEIVAINLKKDNEIISGRILVDSKSINHYGYPTKNQALKEYAKNIKMEYKERIKNMKKMLSKELKNLKEILEFISNQYKIERS